MTSSSANTLAPARLTPNMDRQSLAALSAKIVVVPPDPFVTASPGTDMGRFFRYWNKAKRSAKQPTELGSSVQRTMS